MIRSKNALRDGNCFAQQRLGFFEAIYPHKGVRVVVGCNESYDDKTLLAIAAEVGNLESMRVMMEMGADPRADNGTALHQAAFFGQTAACLLYTSPSPRDQRGSRMPSSA